MWVVATLLVVLWLSSVSSFAQEPSIVRFDKVEYQADECLVIRTFLARSVQPGVAKVEMASYHARPYRERQFSHSH